MDNTNANAMEGLIPPSILPPHYWAISILGMLAVWLLLPPHPVLAPSQLVYGYIVGLAALLLGLWLALRGSKQFASVGTNIVPFTPASHLVTDGVFRISRNPMYTGMVLGLMGIALVSNQLWSWLIVIAFTLVIRYRFIAREEAQMLATFGDDFCCYRQQVRRWV